MEVTVFDAVGIQKAAVYADGKQIGTWEPQGEPQNMTLRFPVGSGTDRIRVVAVDLAGNRAVTKQAVAVKGLQLASFLPASKDVRHPPVALYAVWGIAAALCLWVWQKRRCKAEA